MEAKGKEPNTSSQIHLYKAASEPNEQSGDLSINHLCNKVSAVHHTS